MYSNCHGEDHGGNIESACAPISFLYGWIFLLVGRRNGGGTKRRILSSTPNPYCNFWIPFAHFFRFYIIFEMSDFRCLGPFTYWFLVPNTEDKSRTEDFSSGEASTKYHTEINLKKKFVFDCNTPCSAIRRNMATESDRSQLILIILDTKFHMITSIPNTVCTKKSSQNVACTA